MIIRYGPADSRGDSGSERQQRPPSWKVIGWLAVAFGLLVVAAILNGNDLASRSRAATPASATTTPSARPTSAAQPLREAPCYSSAPYNGDGECRLFGEIVTVNHVIDGDTLQLTDGRTVRLLAVDAPLASACAGPGATSFTRSLVEGKKVELHLEPGTHTDDKGNLWRYVSYAKYMDTASKAPPIYAEDLGNELVAAGWATPKTSGENAEYMTTLTSSAQTAEYTPNGIYAPPCGNAKVQGDNNGNGIADSDEVDVDVNVDVDAPHKHHHLPDGSPTGGFCRHHWWC